MPENVPQPLSKYAYAGMRSMAKKMGSKKIGSTNKLDAMKRAMKKRLSK